MFNRGANAFGGGPARASASGSRDRLSPGDNPPHVPGCRLQPVEFAEVGAGAFSDEVREGERPADTLAPSRHETRRGVIGDSRIKIMAAPRIEYRFRVATGRQ